MMHKRTGQKVYHMMTSSNGNISRVTGPYFFLICAWINGWVNNRDTGDLRRHRAHYDVVVMCLGSAFRLVTGCIRLGTESSIPGLSHKWANGPIHYKDATLTTIIFIKKCIWIFFPWFLNAPTIAQPLQIRPLYNLAHYFLRKGTYIWKRIFSGIYFFLYIMKICMSWYAFLRLLCHMCQQGNND